MKASVGTYFETTVIRHFLPGMEDELIGAAKLTDKVVKCGNIITSRGMGTAIDFGLAIVEYLTGSPEDTKALAKKIVYLDA